jgi:hypothetical protein
MKKAIVIFKIVGALFGAAVLAFVIIRSVSGGFTFEKLVDNLKALFETK